MEYKVIAPFSDLQDTPKSFPKGRVYKTLGETFPATKRKVSKERLEELSGTHNKQGKPLIEKVGEEDVEE